MKKIYTAMLSMAILLGLSACGEDNEDIVVSSPQHPLTQEKWTKFEWTEREFTSLKPRSSTGDQLIALKTTRLSFKDQDLYQQIQYNYAVNNDFYYFYSTAQGRYDRKLAGSSWHLGKVQFNQDEWVLTPVLSAGQAGYQHHYRYKLLDISGQPVLPRIDPDLAIQFNGIPFFDPIYDLEATRLYTDLSQAVFPADAKCIQIESISQNQEALFLTHELQPSSTSQNSYQSSWQSMQNDPRYVKMSFKDTEAYLNPQNGIGYARVGDVFYQAKLQPEGQMYALAAHIENMRYFYEWMAEYGDEGPMYLAQYLQTAPEACDYFDAKSSALIYESMAKNIFYPIVVEDF